MNSNLFHNIVNIVIAIVAALSVPEVAAVLPPELGAKLVGGLAVAKVAVNIARDGLTGLTKPQPPVLKSPRA